MTFRTAFAALALTFGFAHPAAAQSHIVALSEHDEATYRAAFHAIEAGNWRGANAALGRVDDDVLAGVVRGRMLLSRGYRAEWGNYTSWLNRYGEYGIAPAVYERAMDSRSRRARRRGVTAPSPQAGGQRQLPGTPPPILGDTPSARSALERIAEHIGAGDDEDARAIAWGQLERPARGPSTIPARFDRLSRT